MAKKIRWTSEAINNYKGIEDYLLLEWNESVLSKFAAELDSAIEQIIKMPECFPVCELGDGIRRCVLVKQVSLYYKIYTHEIEILTLFDTRQNPQKLKL